MPENTQEGVQDAELVGSQRTQFRAGQSGNPDGSSKAARAARIAAKVAELTADLRTVELTVFDKVLLEQAAALLLRRPPKTHEDQVRVVNTVQRILRGIAKRHGLDTRRRASPGVPSLGELLTRESK